MVVPPTSTRKRPTTHESLLLMKVSHHSMSGTSPSCCKRPACTARGAHIQLPHSTLHFNTPTHPIFTSPPPRPPPPHGQFNPNPTSPCSLQPPPPTPHVHFNPTPTSPCSLQPHPHLPMFISTPTPHIHFNPTPTFPCSLQPQPIFTSTPTPTSPCSLQPQPHMFTSTPTPTSPCSPQPQPPPPHVHFNPNPTSPCSLQPPPPPPCSLQPQPPPPHVEPLQFLLLIKQGHYVACHTHYQTVTQCTLLYLSLQQTHVIEKNTVL